MTKHEQLLENYENALFALLMDEAARQEGEKLREENRLLQEDPAAAVPPQTERRCLRTIRSTLAKTKRKSALRAARRVFSKVSVVVAACIMLFAVAYAAVPEVRVGTLNLLVEVSDVSTKLKLTGTGNVPGQPGSTADDGGITLVGYHFPAPPEGFALDEELVSITDNSAIVWFIKSETEYLYYDVSIVGESTNTYVDTEDAKVTQIEIHGYDGLLIEKEDSIGATVHIIWGDTDRSAFCSIFSMGVDVEVIVSLAEQVSPIEK